MKLLLDCANCCPSFLLGVQQRVSRGSGPQLDDDPVMVEIDFTAFDAGAMRVMFASEDLVVTADHQPALKASPPNVS